MRTRLALVLVLAASSCSSKLGHEDGSDNTPQDSANAPSDSAVVVLDESSGNIDAGGDGAMMSPTPDMQGAGVCNANTQCPSGACRADGSCAMASDIVYVDNKNGACTGTTHAGTKSDPYCQVGDALAATGSTILVAGSTTAYTPIFGTKAYGDKAVVGPGRNANPPASFFDGVNAGIDIVLSSGTLKLSVAGVVIDSRMVGDVFGAVSCDATSSSAMVTFSLARSTVQNGPNDGVYINGCAATIDANEISGNGGTGVYIAAGTASVTNNIIAKNGTSAYGGGLNIAANVTGTFAFNTIADNTNTGGKVGGVSCASANTIVDSIVVGNAAVAGTQLSGCSYDNVVVGTTETSTAMGLSKLDPAFVSATNFRLDMTAGKAANANNACCVDKIANGSTNHDIDQTHRPVRSQWDIGAFEAP